MTQDNKSEEKLREAIRLRQQRRDEWKKSGERSLWQNLSLIGALGWLIVTPTLIGVALGRLLDSWFDTGIFFTGSLIFGGVAVGCYFAWQRIRAE